MTQGIRRLFRNQGSEPTGDRSADWYDAAYEKSDEYQRPYYASRYYPVWSVIADRVRQSGARNVLEIGCGSGQLAGYLTENLDLSSFTGVDFSPKAIEAATQIAPKATFVVADALAPATYERETDLIICTEVLEHIEEDLRVIDLFPAKVRCLCSVPDFPYPSHVRHFTSADEVRDRYGAAFESFDVVTFKAEGSAVNPVIRYFLTDGIKR
jgi:trans-aconitate methyltransferase